MSRSLVTVIMPFFDPPEVFFAEAINSVLAQQHKHWELLLINDGASSAVSKLAQEYSREHCNIHILQHHRQLNLGTSASRNLGITAAKGQYIAFLDADDIWHSDKLSIQLKLFDQHPAVSVIYCNTRYWYSWEAKLPNQKHDYQPPLGLRLPQQVKPPMLLLHSLQGRTAVPCMGSIILKRAQLDYSGGFENSFHGLYDDQVFYAKLWLKATVLVTEHCLDSYRQHQHSMTANTSGTTIHQQARRAYLEWLTQHLRCCPMQDLALSNSLKLELFINSSRLSPLLERCRRLYWKTFNHYTNQFIN